MTTSNMDGPRETLARGSSIAWVPTYSIPNSDKYPLFFPIRIICVILQSRKNNLLYNTGPDYKLFYFMVSYSKNTLELKGGRMERKIDRILSIMNSDMRASDRLITVREAAKMLGISEYCLRKEIKDGNIKAKRNGRAFKLSYLDVKARLS